MILMIQILNYFQRMLGKKFKIMAEGKQKCR
jgi:hypothetical protein